MADTLCRRCGTCCRRGGPTLMGEDALLLAEGVLALEDMVCLRAGEWARDDQQACLRPLDCELVKLARWRPGTGTGAHPWCCPHLEEGPAGASCAVYRYRPAQCSMLLCTHTAQLTTRLTQGNMLDRTAVLEALPEDILPATTRALWQELTATHEAQCPAGECLALAAVLGFRPHAVHDTATVASTTDMHEARARLTFLARTDAAFRDLCCSRGRIPEDVLPFLLGRPVAVLLAEVGCLPQHSTATDS